MILTELKQYIIEHPNCSRKELANAFSLSEDGIEAMLAVWTKKGELKITRSKKAGMDAVHYHWVQKNELGLVVFQ
ncbi:FeoC-like transcriptional regulator [Enterovibrio sp. ZSDZ35]|uniref:FeoC-like transcriptional regulator n=1 Tax=Enterovibrio qingdaonensis TaxID=2899818 RepID=A0ABT5QQZ7_9GAMM|nr:FeoC-like transcriptional regulator [Enterovibrio sp. ZSDZ35]MDD1783014.1 FeoC-like transcriptional regulator [Enterovibrio sp. ZSDZ35]